MCIRNDVDCIWGYLCGRSCHGGGFVLLWKVDVVVLGVANHSFMNLTM